MVELKREMPKLIKDKRVIIPLDDRIFDQLHKMAFKHECSISYLGSIAILKMLLEEKRGQFTLVPEFLEGEDMYNA